MNANLYALIRAHFDERAAEPCVLIPDGRVIHYDELDATSARFAHALADTGCRPGDRVAVQVEKCWEALALYLACLRAGFVYLPLNTGYQKSELGYFFRGAGFGAASAGDDVDPRRRGRDAARARLRQRDDVRAGGDEARRSRRDLV